MEELNEPKTENINEIVNHPARVISSRQKENANYQQQGKKGRQFQILQTLRGENLCDPAICKDALDGTPKSLTVAEKD